MLVDHAREGVEVGPRIDRVLRKVGEAVVLERVDVGRKQIVASRIAERDAEARHGQVVARKIEAFEQPPIGSGGVADQDEVNVVAWDTLVRELLHCQRRERGALRVVENHDGICGVHVPPPICPRIAESRIFAPWASEASAVKLLTPVVG